MMRHCFLLFLGGGGLLFLSLASGEQTPVRLAEDTLRGTLDAPLPYEVVRVFPEQTFRNPVEFLSEPGTGRILICQVNGEILAFDPAEPAAESARVLDLRDEIPGLSQLYGMALHPDYAENRLVYLCYVLAEKRPDGTQVIECRMDPESGRLRLDQSRLLLTWLSGGHNGGSLQFGPDGYLYISSGDGEGPNPPDALGAGQDCSNLLSSILRIDVDRRDPGLAYRVPPDNPFSDTAGVRPEIWSYGYRNPWRMSFDGKTGELWVGDVGWDTWEMVYYVRRGENFGWSVMEGRQPINVTWMRGPTPISPPMAEHPHSEARSITGGYVYRGERFPELKGAYLYGDYETGKIWALWQKRGERIALREIADCELRIICFGQTPDGEIYVLDYAGGIYELHPRALRGDRREERAAVPRFLSQTGLFAPKDGHLLPADGLVPYEILHPMWSDGLTAQRWLGLPQGAVRLDGSRVYFPENALLVKTLRRPGDGKPVETQILQKVAGFWRGFSYAWNATHTEAELVPGEGARRAIGAEGSLPQLWHSVGRSECMVCHNAHTDGALGFSTWQLDDESRARLRDLGWMQESAPRRRGRRRPVQNAIVSRQRPAARTYLDVNCASCHRENGGGLVPMKLGRDLPADRLAAVGVLPQRGDFGIRDARVISAGRPERSTLYYRMAKQGSGRMPHLGSQVVDEAGLRLVHDWIESLDPGADRSLHADETVSRALQRLHAEGREALRAELVPEPTDPFVADLLTSAAPVGGGAPGADASVGDPDAILRLDGDRDRGRQLLLGARGGVCLTCHRLGSAGRGFGPPFDGIGARRSREHLLEGILNPSREIATAYVNYTVTTDDDRSFTGFITHHDSERLVMVDAALQELVVPVVAIATMGAAEQSVMPAGLAGAFTEQELADVLAYLQSLR